MSYILIAVYITIGTVITIPFDDSELCEKAKTTLKNESLIRFENKGIQKNLDTFTCLKVKK